jgi:hypothetical protein
MSEEQIIKEEDPTAPPSKKERNSHFISKYCKMYKTEKQFANLWSGKMKASTNNNRHLPVDDA